MKSKHKIAIAVATSLAWAIGAFWFWSPYWSIYEMRAAATARDADAFNAYVDYPRLRESLKGQFAARLAEEMGSDSSDGGSSSDASSAASTGSALGTMLGMVMIDRFVDALVRPEVMMRAMQQGRFGGAGAGSEAGGDINGARSEPAEWSVERKGTDKCIVYAKVDAKTAADNRMALVFERSGFSTWKLTEVRMPG